MNDPARPPAAASRYRIVPVADQHVAESSRMILEVAARVGKRRAIALGAGKCQEIALAKLASQFDQIVLVDLDRSALEEGLAAAELTPDQRRKIDIRIADLTGVTDRLERAWRDAMADASDPTDAIERLAAVTDGEMALNEPGAATLSGETFDLVIASCLLSQLHAPAARRAEQVFAERFADSLAQLRSAARWLGGLQALARRIEASFIDRLPSLVAPGGRIYLSETVQTCLTELAADGAWSTAGTYRMTKSLDLADYIDHRFEIERRGRWTWVAALPQSTRPGKLFDVQSLVLKTASDR
jgi:hypothetical protein